MTAITIHSNHIAVVRLEGITARIVVSVFFLVLKRMMYDLSMRTHRDKTEKKVERLGKKNVRITHTL